jgi:hypothetical protein
MINLRYHIVSLVAVFLALALGVVMGSTVFKDSLTAAQRALTNQVVSQAETLRQQKNQLDAQNNYLQTFGAAVLPGLLRDKLRGRHVVVLQTDQVDNGTWQDVRDTLRLAGATVDGRVTFPADRLSLQSDGDRVKLAELVGQAGDGADPQGLRDTLLEQLTDRLVVSDRLPTDSAGRAHDTLASLASAKFASLDLTSQVKDGKAAFPEPGSLFVIIGPSDGNPALAPDQFLVPLARKLADKATAPVAGVEAWVGTSSWVQELRADKDANQRVSSIDDVDQVFGEFALIQALADQLQNPSEPPGRYGTKAGNDGLLPKTATAPTATGGTP